MDEHTNHIEKLILESSGNVCELSKIVDLLGKHVPKNKKESSSNE
jgi:hypothetical protein